MRRLGVLSAVALVLALPASASATLVFQRGLTDTAVWAANDDGTGQRRLAAGREPYLSPDGGTVAFGNRWSARNPRLQVIPATGGTPRTILRGWRFGAFAWSPDGSTIATVAGPEVGRQRLVLVDVATGTSRTVASGYFSGASFSPDGSQLAYGRGTSQDQLFAPTDVWAVPTAGGVPRRLTTDGHGLYPLFRPTHPTQIVFTRWQRPTGRHAREDGPKYQLWLMAPDGSGPRQLTRGRIPFLLTGLTPTAWSADGTRLLAEFGGQDTSYPVTVDPVTGAQRAIGQRSRVGIVGDGLSKDGTTILAHTGGFEYGESSNVVTVPYAGGRPTVLVRHAALGAWTR